MTIDFRDDAVEQVALGVGLSGQVIGIFAGQPNPWDNPITNAPLNSIYFQNNGMVWRKSGPGFAQEDWEEGIATNVQPTITVADEGADIFTGPIKFDFVGDGVTATEAGGVITVTIPGGDDFNPCQYLQGLPALSYVSQYRDYLWIYDGSSGTCKRVLAKKIGGDDDDDQWKHQSISRTTTAPPGSPAEDDQYIVPVGATGAWSGHDHELAVWCTDPDEWHFIAPIEGFFSWVWDEDKLYHVDQTLTWQPFQPGGAGGEDPVYVDYYDTSYTTVQGSATTLDLNTNRQSNAAFSRSGGTVTCNENTTARVDYDVSTNDSATGDNNVEFWIEKNSVEIPGTRSRIFHDAAYDGNPAHGMAILDLVDGDTLRVRGQRVSGTGLIDTLPNSFRLMIHTIGANGVNGTDGTNGTNGTDGADGADGATGPQGPAGPPGSGSTVNLAEGGSPVPNTPHDTIDFDGADFDVSDNADGSATVTLAAAAHTHSNKAQLDLVTDGDHDVRTDNPHGVTAVQVGAEPAFTKNTAFNKDFGTGTNDVARGDHTHAGGGGGLPDEYDARESLGSSSTVSPNWASKIAFTTATVPPGVYRISAFSTVWNSAGDKRAEARLYVEGSERGWVRVTGKNGSDPQSVAFVHRETVTSSETLSIQLEFRNGSDGGTTYIADAVVEVWRVE